MLNKTNRKENEIIVYLLNDCYKILGMVIIKE